MTESHTEQKDHVSTPRRYPKWRLVVGLVLLVGAIAHYLSTLYQPVLPFPYLDRPPDPIRVSSSLRFVESIQADQGALAGANLLVITLDTTRADGLACYGNQEIETPALDELAESGILFATATAVAPITLPSHSSILTGLYPTNHGARANGFYRLDDSNVTLAEVLRDHGYTTGAIISAFVLDSQFGLKQGFETYEDDLRDGVKPNTWAYRQRNAEKTTDRALKWIESAATQDSPFMLWVHYFDPHAMYEPPSPFAEDYKENLYFGEIAYVDSQIARITSSLRELDLVEKTLVVVVGDHGESLGQHNELSHGFLAYEATLRVPFIMSCGKRLGGGVYTDRRVSQVDVMPTVLALMGIEAPAPLDGINVLAGETTGRPVFCETLHGTLTHGFAPILGVYDQEYKYLHGPDPELYVLADDPNELDNVLPRDKAKAAELMQRLIEVFGQDLDNANLSAPAEMLSASAAAKLEALGYAGAPAALSDRTVRPDPKSVMPAMRRLEQIIYMDESHLSPEDKVVGLEKLSRDYPDFHPVFRHLGGAYADAGKLDLAIEAYRHCLDISPDLSSLYALARIHAQMEDAEGAEAIARKLIATYPDHLPTRVVLAGIASTQGRHDEAADQYRYIFESDPDYRQPGMPMCAIQVVQAFLIAGRASELPDMLNSVLDRYPLSPGARAALANYHVHSGDLDKAEEILRDGVKLAPDDAAMAANLAVLLCQMPSEGTVHRIHEGLLIMEELCRKNQYRDPELLGTLSVLYSIAGRRDDGIATAKRAKALAEEVGNQPLAKSLETLMTQQQTAPAGDSVIHPSVFVPGG